MALTEDNVCEYVRTLLPIKGCALRPEDTLQSLEIHGGNLNYAFRVVAQADSARSVFVKQAPDFIKCLGPEAALSSARIALESAVLCEYNRLAPAFTPRHLHFDSARAIILMEDLAGHVLLRDELLAGRVHVGDGRALGTFMGLTHKATWRGGGQLADVDSDAYAARFSNDLLCGITSEYIFRKPYDPQDASNRSSSGLADVVAALRADSEGVASAAAELNAAFLGKKQCLIHGDLHSGSVMVAATAAGSDAEPTDEEYARGRLRCFDPEFACFGAAAFDVGLALAAYAFAFHHHAAAGDPAALPAIAKSAAALWGAYEPHLEQVARATGDGDLARATLSEATGFMGAELVRRVIGAAHVPDLEGIEDSEARIQAERAVLHLGCEALKGWRNVSTLDALVALITARGGTES